MNLKQFTCLRHRVHLILILSGLVMVGNKSILAAPPSAMSRAPDVGGQTETVETYHFNIPLSRLTVRMVGVDNPHAASITWMEHGQTRQQYLSMSPGWWPATSLER